MVLDCKLKCVLDIFYRILELKHEMLNLELLEFHYFDDIISDLKLTPVRMQVNAGQ